MNDLGILNDVLFAFEEATLSWVATFHGIALSLFWSLGTIELAWSGVRLVLKPNASLLDAVELLVRKAVYFGFVYLLVVNASPLVTTILSSFQHAGGLASGVDRLHPSAFLSTGVAIAAHHIESTATLGVLNDPLGIFMALGAACMTLVAFAIMAGIIVMTLCEAYIATGGLSFLLAFGASRWTAGIADGALSYVVRVGVKLMVLYLLAGVINELTQRWARTISTSVFTGPVTYLGFVATCCVLALVLWNVPRLVSNLVRPTLTFGLSPSVADN